DTSLSIAVHDTGSIAHQTTGFRELSREEDCGNGMTCRQPHELVTLAEQERIRGDSEGVGLLPDGGGESLVDLALGAGIEHIDLNPRVPAGLHVAHLIRGWLIIRIDEKRTPPKPLRCELVEKLQSLRPQLRKDKSHAGGVAAGLVEAGYETSLNGVAAGREDNRDRGGRRLCGPARWFSTSRGVGGPNPPSAPLARHNRQPEQ